MILIGAVRGGVFGVIVIVCGSVLAAALGYPVVAGIVLRIPAVTVGPDGIRLPLIGVRLSWAEIADVRTGLKANGRTPVAVMLVVPTDPAAVVRQARWWLRREARADLARLALRWSSTTALSTTASKRSGGLSALTPDIDQRRGRRSSTHHD